MEKREAPLQKRRILIISVDQETHDVIIEKISLICEGKSYNEVIVVITDPFYSKDLEKMPEIDRSIKKYCSFVETISVGDPWKTTNLRKEIMDKIIKKIDELCSGETEKGVEKEGEEISCRPTEVEVTINFTGGNRIVNFLLLAEFLGWIRENLTVKFECHGDEGKYFLDDKIYHKWTLEQIYDSIHYCKYAEAHDLSRYLPKKYIWVRPLTEALVKWDNFEYGGVRKNFGKLQHWISIREIEGDFYEAEKFCINLIKTLMEFKKDWESFEKKFQILEKSETPISEVEDTLDYLVFFLADMVVKSEIQYINQKYAEGMLRAYRACEMATQIKLIIHNINPWNFNTSSFKQNFPESDHYIEEFKKIVQSDERFKWFKPSIPEINKLRLFDSISLLYIVDENFRQNIKEIMKSLTSVANRRNRLFLTHGFLTSTEKEWEDVLKDVKDVISIILSSDLNKKFEEYYITLRSAFIDEKVFKE